MDISREELLYSPKNGYDRIDEVEKALIHDYCEDYKRFLDRARTERMAVKAGIELAEKAGFVPFERGMELRPGTKVYSSVHGKALLLAVMGEETMDKGCVIAAAHVDSPRLDLKQNPMYEDTEMAFFKTHYYGGLRKYQWPSRPLELHGTVALKNGGTVEISIGQDREDPQFIITDLLPHLASDQSKKILAEAVSGESLNILIGSVPGTDGDSDRVKTALLRLLHEKYGIVEEDFLSAELCATPAVETRDQGLDRSFIGGYGHDDRVCAYAELRAIAEMDKPRRTCVCILADKEEIGSEGISGMKSEAFECFVEDLCDSQGVKLRHCFEKSLCISADVCNGFDPNFPEVSEKRNSAKMNYGVCLVKYTGSRGKYDSNDASAELIGRLRAILDENKVVWQMGELGKVDQGGGGTVAMYMAQRNIETIDAGVPVLSMHSPCETVAKLDCYMTYKAFKAVYSA
ncbi:MAG: aminopeptidase [Candidatus Heteroscillospira sp.]|jgi:aspartyl aminopeptidase